MLVNDGDDKSLIISFKIKLIFFSKSLYINSDITWSVWTINYSNAIIFHLELNTRKNLLVPCWYFVSDSSVFLQKLPKQII